MELLLGLVVGLIMGLVAGASVVAVRAARERGRRQAAVDAELQAARQQAERATGETQALRARLATAEVLAGGAMSGALPPGASGVAAITGPLAETTVAAQATSPDPRPSASPPVAEALAVPEALPNAEAAPVTPALDPTTGWHPVRPGLSDPHAWLGTTAPSGTPYVEDDLERIHGVGPYLARRLRDEGILTYRQVAEWDEDDMALVSRRIGSFPDRIRREDWPASARDLHARAYGESLA